MITRPIQRVVRTRVDTSIGVRYLLHSKPHVRTGHYFYYYIIILHETVIISAWPEMSY